MLTFTGSLVKISQDSCIVIFWVVFEIGENQTFIGQVLAFTKGGYTLCGCHVINILDLDENYMIFLNLTDNNDMHKASRAFWAKLHYSPNIYFWAQFEPYLDNKLENTALQ